MQKFIYYNGNEHLEIELLDVGFIKQIQDNSFTVFFIRMDKNYEILKKDLVIIDLNKVGDEHNNKICNRCYKYLDINHFQDNRLKKDNKMTKRPSCKDCRKIIDGKSIKASIKKDWNKIKPHNTLFECKICKKSSIAGLTKIVLDHNHTTGEVRGWLCESCNTGLGRFKDDPDILDNAKKWLTDKIWREKK
tara:strand:+ start:54 stop:626 length:573 start_codon:yes stop_codon:yes gene_type:complete